MSAQRFGLIAGGAASAVVVAWLAFSGGPAKTVRAEVDPTAAGSVAAGSARADLAEGKRLYLTREYAKSAAVLGRAMAHPEDLSALERQDLESYLRRSREAVARASSQQSGVTTAAFERPVGAPEARVAQADAISDRYVGDAAPSRMQLASFEQPAQPVMSGGTPKEQAASLMAQARALAKAGRFDEARAIALKATELPVSWGLFDERPQHLIAEIDRSARTRTILPEYPVASTQTSAPSTIRGQSPVDAGTDQAQSLLREARTALKAGDLAAAEAKVAEAETLDIVYGVFDDRPELIRKDLEQIYAGNARPNQNIAAAPTGGAPSETKQRATDLLRQARLDLQAGNVKDALAKAEEAETMGVTYGLFEDRPELIVADAGRLGGRDPNTAIAGTTREANPFTADESAAGSATEAAPQQTAMVASSGEDPAVAARELLRQARIDLEAGRTDIARQKATAAAKYEVTYGLLDDRPELLLADIDAGAADSMRPNTANVAEASPRPENPFVAPQLGNDVSVDPFEAGGTIEQASGRPMTALAELPVVTPDGASALELYDFAVARLKANDSEGAYAAFLQAHRTGQRLDAYRQQQLQNYLRELAPKANGIKLASATSDGPSIGNDPGYLPASNDPLKAATQAEAVKFDKLRTEVLNAIFRAERLRESNPTEAISILDRAGQELTASGLTEQTVAPLKRQLDRSKSSIESYAKQMAPKIELNEQNAKVKEDIKRELQAKAQVEAEMKKLVDKYNELVKQRSYAEAILVAKEAKELDPENPVTVTLLYKAKVLYEESRNSEVRDGKADYFLEALHQVDVAAIGIPGEIEYPKSWNEMSEKRKGKYGKAARVETEEEKRIRHSLDRQISLHFDNVPLSQVITDIRSKADINVVIDMAGLDEEGVTSDTPVSIDVDGIMLKSALNLLLEPLNLGYMVDNEVLNVTSRLRRQGQLDVQTYPVADLVVPIPNFGSNAADGLKYNGPGVNGFGTGFVGAGNMSVPSFGAPQGQAMAQIEDPTAGFNPMSAGARVSSSPRGVQFDTLVDLISSTIEPGSWEIVGGNGVLRPNETTLSLVVRQTQQVHDQIADLLDQLRRLQDLQVTVEVRFITVTDNFLEYVGVDFDFNVQDTIGGPIGPGFGSQLNPGVPPSGGGVAGQQGQQGQQGQGGQQQPTADFFEPPNPDRDLRNYDSYRNGTVVGMGSPGSISPDLDIPFRQGSFNVGVPSFATIDEGAAAEIGFAVLSDIEAFFFIRAIQQDNRSNLLFAPKITLFNGQTATINDSIQRPFVTSITPIVGIQSVGFQPQITVIPDGIFLTVQAVISADRRYVRLTLGPSFNTIIDVQTFTFNSGGNVGATAGGVAGQLGQGAGLGGAGGGLTGGGGVGGGTIAGLGGIGGGRLANNALLAALPAQVQGGFGGGQQGQQQGQQGQQAQQGQGGATGRANLGQTVQQPIFSQFSISTTVSVPDGGTVLLGGVKRLREGRNMTGVPILNKIPYISRLFKNSGVARQTESLMLMVTPRIIIQEEEEELLGVAI